MCRCDISAMDLVPPNLRHAYQVLIDFFNEMEQELAKEGKAYRVYYAKFVVSLLNNSDSLIFENNLQGIKKKLLRKKAFRINFLDYYSFLDEKMYQSLFQGSPMVECWLYSKM